MITTTEMYWLVTLDSIVHMSTVLIFVSALAFFAAIGVAADMRRLFWLPLIPIGMFFLSVAITTFTPTTKQAAAIILVPKIVNNEKMQVVGNQLYDLAVDWMRELQPPEEGGQVIQFVGFMKPHKNNSE